MLCAVKFTFPLPLGLSIVLLLKEKPHRCLLRAALAEVATLLQLWTELWEKNCLHLDSHSHENVGRSLPTGQVLTVTLATKATETGGETPISKDGCADCDLRQGEASRKAVLCVSCRQGRETLHSQQKWPEESLQP